MKGNMRRYDVHRKQNRQHPSHLRIVCVPQNFMFRLPLRVLLSLSLFLFISLPAAHTADPRGDNPDAPSSTPEQELAKFHVPPGFEVQLVAAEPRIQKPVNMTFDAAGRLWVTGSELYPWPASVDALGKPIPDFARAYADIAAAFHVGDKAPPITNVARDTVRILSDFSPDGAARKIEVFADGLNVPSGIQPLPRQPGAKGDTAIVYSIPNIWRIEDTDGDGKADKREVLYSMFGFLDTHGGSSSYLYWIDGWIYGTHGFRNHSEVRDRNGKTVVIESGNTYRFRPDGSAFEVYTHGQTNPFGLTVDPLGNFYSADSHSKPVYMLLRGGYYEGIGKQHDGLGFAPRITDDDHGSSAIAGIAYYADDKYPEEFRGNLFNGNPVTQKVNRDKLEWHGSTPKAIRQPDFITSDDPWFRPVQVKLGPDGALYIADFYNPIIGHYEFPLADPRRDHTHGRIWRVVWRGEKKDAPVTAPPDLANLDATGLITRLADSNLIVRTLATNELTDRLGATAIAPLQKTLEAEGQKLLESVRSIPAADVEEKMEMATAAKVATTGLQSLQLAHALWALDRLGGIHTVRMKDIDFHPDAAFRVHLSKIAAARVRRLNEGQPIAPNDGRPFVFSALGGEMRVEMDIATHALYGTKRSPLTDRAAAEAVASFPSALLIHTDIPDQFLRSLLAAPPDDPELGYALRAAYRDQLAQTGAYSFYAHWIENHQGIDRAQAAATTAEVSLAVPTAEAAEFLLLHLERTKLAAPRAAEYLKHALLYLPPEKFDAVMKLITQMGETAGPQKLALAASLSDGVRQRGITAPPAMTAWSQGIILDALSNASDDLARTAVAAVKEQKVDAKLAPLAKIVGDQARDAALRLAAMDAAANLPASKDLLVATFADQDRMSLRKRAAELLVQSGVTDGVLAALPGAPNELAISISGALAKTDAGAAALLALIDAGKTSPRLLLNRAVSGPMAARPQPLRDRVGALVKDLPPEDARLNALVAERAVAFAKTKTDAAHGAQVFQQTCAVCHRFRNAGGNVGPNLDGVIAHGPARLIEDILDPNRNVDPLFRQTTIETTDGETFIGANIRDQGDTLLLADATGKDQTIKKSRIKKQAVSPLSLMPPVFEQAIPPGDFYDLLGYLLSPSAAP